jgi:ABC-type multidrug transport system fused ATPase/permease subunit
LLDSTQTDKQTRLHALERHITRLNHRIDDLRALSDQFVRLRVAIVVVSLVVAFLAFSLLGNVAGWASVVLAFIIFNVAAYYHRQVQGSIQRHIAWRRIKIAHIARINLDWERIPAEENLPVPPDHPFAMDLDLVGERSIHRLIDTSVSREGSERIQKWLLNTLPDLPTIEKRQTLIHELIPLTTFRDKLILNGRVAAGSREQRIDGKKLLSWFEHHGADGPQRKDVLIAAGLAAINITLMVLFSLGALPPLWLISFVVYAMYVRAKLQSAGDLFSQSMSLGGVVANLNAVFHFLETYRYGANTNLKALSAPFLDAHNRPSAQLRRIGFIVSAVSLRTNAILWGVINFFIPWDLYFASLLNQRKAEIAAQMPLWLDVWFELETLNALANFAHLNPEYTFPTVNTSGVFKGETLGHPLIPFTAKICNDFALNQRGFVVIITGSNMAGKSSFLRTLGVNLCLAYAGAPVNAKNLEIGLFRVFTCIKVSDSVTDGFSYFYAEVRRLKALLTELERDYPYPLFFLIDEIFKGTNNRERLIGSRAYIRALVGRNGMGVVSTHDLELVRLADELPHIRNEHFKEDVIDGRMVFDYRLRPGPSPTTNALKIMQLEGLPVEATAALTEDVVKNPQNSGVKNTNLV